MTVEHADSDDMLGRGESKLYIHGDGVVFPLLNRDQVDALISNLVAWLNHDDEVKK